MLSVVILNVVKLNVIMLSVVAPFLGPLESTNIRLGLSAANSHAHSALS